MTDYDPNDLHLGYRTADNTGLQENRRLAQRMGELRDVMSYPPIDNPPNYTPTMDPTSESLSSKKRAVNTIEVIYKRMTGQSAEDTRKLAGHWSALGWTLQAMAEDTLAKSRKLQEKWRSPAAEVFLARGPGATIKSLEDWSTAAHINASALRSLADIIDKHKAKIDTLFKEYIDGAAIFQNGIDVLASGRGDKDVIEFERKRLLTNLQDYESGFNERAQEYEKAMADDYFQVASSARNGTSTRYEGPTDSVVPPPASAFLPQFGSPGAPRLGSPPSFGSRPNVPAVPTNLVAPAVPALPTPPVPPAVPLPSPVVGAAPKLPGLPGAIPGGLPSGLPPGLTPGANPGGAPNLPPGVNPAALAGVPGLAQAYNPAMAPSAGGAGGLANTGLGGNSPLLPPSPGAGAPKKARDKSGMDRGVLRAGASPSGQELGGAPPLGAGGLPAPPATAQPGRRTGGRPGSAVPPAGSAARQGTRQNTATPGVQAPAMGQTDAFTAPSAAAVTPPVLGRCADRSSPSTAGPRGALARPAGSPPSGATSPVLGRRGPAAQPGPTELGRGGRGTAPGQPGSIPGLNAGGQGGAGSSNIEDRQWLPGTENVAAPLLENRTHAGVDQRDEAALLEAQKDTARRPGATAPVLGRRSAAVVGGAPGAEQLGGRFASDGGQPTGIGNPEILADTTAPITDETAFTVQTPGGPVLTNRAQAHVASNEPRPNLSAG